jgi:hypothetical protein
MKDYNQYIDAHTTRCEASYRGGGIEIDCGFMFPYIDNAFMSAYQNYLGGGVLGAIQNSISFDTTLLTNKDKKVCNELQEALKRYFHNLTNHEGDEWEEESYEQNQLTKPVSAY